MNYLVKRNINGFVFNGDNHYQNNSHCSPQISEHQNRPRHLALDVHVNAWKKHISVTGFNRSFGIMPPPLLYTLNSNDNTDIKKQTKTFTNSLPPKKTMHHKQLMTTTAWSVHRQCQFLSLIEENKIVYIIFQFYIFYLIETCKHGIVGITQ